MALLAALGNIVMLILGAIPAGAMRSGDDWLTETDLEREYRLAKGTWRNWRYQHRGPRFSRAGSWVLYRRRDVDAWLDANSEPGG